MYLSLKARVIVVLYVYILKFKSI